MSQRPANHSQVVPNMTNHSAIQTERQNKMVTIANYSGKDQA